MSDGERILLGRITDRLLQTRFGSGLKHVTKHLALHFYRKTRSLHLIRPIKWATWTILSIEEIRVIHDVVCKRSPCNVLVFGLGDDSPVWAATNRGGYTLFIEDDQEWIEEVIGEHSGLNVQPYEYETVRKEWEQLLGSAEELLMDLPDEVMNRTWDVILVDAPAGYAPELPGRMQSIYTARQLAASGTDVFVHDIDRRVEEACCEAFFSTQDQENQVERLRHYRVS